MKILKLITLIVLVAVIGSCHKDKDTNVLSDGTYSGQFKAYTALTGNTTTDTFVIKLAYPSYSSYTSLQSNTVTAEGSYKVSGSQITFTNTVLFNVNVDTRAVVNGTYNFKVNGNTLTLVQVIYDYSASYDLTKQ